MMKRSTVIGSEKNELRLYEWEVSNAKHNVFILHGMAEHGRRYEHFAKFLNGHSISVFAIDWRGHGETSEKSGARGFLAEKDGWHKCLDDAKCVIEKLQETRPQSWTIFGHSAGSIMTCGLLCKYKTIVKNIVLSAFPPHPGILLPAGKTVSSILGTIFPKDAKSELMNDLTFGRFNAKIKDPRTKYDWLSRDEKQVDLYINDPDCGEVFSNRFFYDLLSGLEYAHGNLRTLDTELKILLLHGSNDPVVEFQKGINKVTAKFMKLRNQIDRKVYEEARHEILNEINNQEVYSDILSWIEANQQ